MSQQEGAGVDADTRRASSHGRDAVAPTERPVGGGRGVGSRMQFNISSIHDNEGPELGGHMRQSRYSSWRVTKTKRKRHTHGPHSTRGIPSVYCNRTAVRQEGWSCWPWGGHVGGVDETGSIRRAMSRQNRPTPVEV